MTRAERDNLELTAKMARKGDINEIKGDSYEISIVIPAYNEQAAIGDVIDGLKKKLKNKNCEIIVDVLAAQSDLK